MAFLIYLLASQSSVECRLECDRGPDVCVMRDRLLTRTRTFDQRLSGISSAEVRVSSGGRRTRPVISLWIRPRSGERASYFDDYPTRAGAQADADRFNAFLRSPAEPRFSLIRNHAAIYGIAWLLAAVVSALVGFLGYVLFRREKPPV